MDFHLDKWHDLKGWQGALYLTGLGGISALAFPPTYFIFILFFSFPLLLHSIDRSKNWKCALMKGYWFGFGLHTIGLSWLVNAILIRAQDFWWLVPIVSPLCAILLALWTGLPTLFYYWIKPSKKLKIFVFAGLWTVCDMSRAVMLPPNWWNPVLTGFPWNPLASTWEIPGRIGDIFIQTASLIGVDGLTLITVILVLLPLYGKKGWMIIAGTICGLALFGSYRLVEKPPITDNNTPIVALIQGNIAEDDKIANTDPRRIFQKYMQLTSDAVVQAVTLRQELGQFERPIIYAWPESSFPGSIQYDDAARKVMMQNNPDASFGIIGAITQQEPNVLYNSLVVLRQPDGAIDHVYNKVKLVPFGESQPWYIPFHVVPGQVLTPGEGNVTLNLSRVSSFAPLICYEVIFSGQILDYKNRPKWILNLTNDAWYGNSAGPRQHLAAARLRAVEEGIPVVRVANTGISAVYDSYGRKISQIDWGVKGVRAVALPGALSFTLFSLGHRFIPFCLSLICIFTGVAGKFLSRGEIIN